MHNGPRGGDVRTGPARSGREFWAARVGHGRGDRRPPRRRDVSADRNSPLLGCRQGRGGPANRPGDGGPGGVGTR
jgi:hypothetical protein